MAFYSILLNYMEIWDIYFSYFLMSGVVMYILFAKVLSYGENRALNCYHSIQFTFFVMFVTAVLIYIRSYKQRKKEHLNEIERKK